MFLTMSSRAYRPNSGPRHAAERKVSNPVPRDIVALHLPGRKGGLVEVPLISPPHTPTLRQPDLTESTLKPAEPNYTSTFGVVPEETAAPSLGDANFKVGESTADRAGRIRSISRAIGVTIARARNRSAQPTIEMERNKPSWEDIRTRNYEGYHDYHDFDEVPKEVRERYRKILGNEAVARANGRPVTTLFADYSEWVTGPEKGVVEPKNPWPTPNEIGTTYLISDPGTISDHQPVHHQS